MKRFNFLALVLLVASLVFLFGAYTPPDKSGVSAFITEMDTTVTDTLDVYREIQGAFTNKVYEDFTVAVDGITYTGKKTVWCLIFYSANYTTDKSANVVTFAVENGSGIVTGSEFSFKTQTAGYYGHVSAVVAVELETNDVLSLVVKSDKADTSIFIHGYTTALWKLFP